MREAATAHVDVDVDVDLAVCVRIRQEDAPLQDGIGLEWVEFEFQIDVWDELTRMLQKTYQFCFVFFLFYNFYR
jgi:hypothetical protein